LTFHPKKHGRSAKADRPFLAFIPFFFLKEKGTKRSNKPAA
jgi:hypothetical protein